MRYFIACVCVAFGSGMAAADDKLGFVDDFKTLNASAWHVANYDFNHPHFDTDWRADRVVLEKGLTLELRPQSAGANRFAGASIRRQTPTGFGRYEAVIQPARGAGLITGFFTYTGAYYGDQHDEIDIEFLGRDTTKLHVAWFIDGKLTNRFIDLGFDAADAPRRYAFEWRPDQITWFVEGEEVFTHSVADGPVPQTPGRLFANIWAADPKIAIWSGVAEAAASAQAHVSEMSFTPLAELEQTPKE